MRAAASSSASGMPSSRAQIAAMVGASAGVSAKVGLTARARCTNSVTAAIAGQVFERGQARQIRCVKRRHSKLMLPAHPQRNSTGDQRLDSRTRRQQLRDLRSGLNHLFEVIEHKQQFLPGEVVERVVPSPAGLAGRADQAPALSPVSRAQDHELLSGRRKQHWQSWRRAPAPPASPDGSCQSRQGRSASVIAHRSCSKHDARWRLPRAHVQRAE